MKTVVEVSEVLRLIRRSIGRTGSTETQKVLQDLLKAVQEEIKVSRLD